MGGRFEQRRPRPADPLAAGALLVVSPHYDDAALSLGLLLRGRTRAGLRTAVVNVCAAPPSDPAEAAYVAARRAEDLRALRLLGVEEVHWLARHDAIYRVDAGGQRRYPPGPALFGRLDPSEVQLAVAVADDLAALLAGFPAETVVCAPVAVGDHVDHRLAHSAARLLGVGGRPVVCYEDLPYALEPGATEAALETRRADGWPGLRATGTREDLATKCAALELYETQRSCFEEGDVVAGCRRHALAQAGADGLPAERLWQFPAG